MKSAHFVIALAAGLANAATVSGQTPASDPAAGAPSPTPTTGPAAGQSPYAYPPPPGYAYPPAGYAYPPPGYAYPPPGYAYPPGYGPYPPAYPGYYQTPPVAKPTPPFRRPTGDFRLGVNVGAFLSGKLSYSLSFRGEALVSHSASAAATPGLAIFAEYQPIRFVFVGFTIQYLATVKWAHSAPVDSTSSSPTASPYGGTGHEIDFLPRLGISYPVAPRVRLVASGAPGYSMIDASNMIKVYADPGTVRGFTIQGDAGAQISFSEHGFVQGRLSYQSSFLESSATSETTGQTAAIDLHASYWGVNGGIGYWF